MTEDHAYKQGLFERWLLIIWTSWPSLRSGECRDTGPPRTGSYMTVWQFKGLGRARYITLQFIVLNLPAAAYLYVCRAAMQSEACRKVEHKGTRLVISWCFAKQRITNIFYISSTALNNFKQQDLPLKYLLKNLYSLQSSSLSKNTYFLLVWKEWEKTNWNSYVNLNDSVFNIQPLIFVWVAPLPKNQYTPRLALAIYMSNAISIS